MALLRAAQPRAAHPRAAQARAAEPRARARGAPRGGRAFRRIGLLADSHGQAETTLRAARLLVEAGAEVLLHLGDLGSAAVLDALAEAALPALAVLGNIDVPAEPLRRRARKLGIELCEPSGRIEGAGKKLVFLHGHLQEPLRKALAEGVDYLCHGHSHRLRDERVGPTRVINPGALFRARNLTVALLDLETDRLEVLPVARA